MDKEKKISDVVRERIKDSFGFKSKLIMNNGYAIIGVLGKCDDTHLEIQLDNNKGVKIIPLEDIAEVTIYRTHFDKEKEGVDKDE